MFNWSATAFYFNEYGQLIGHDAEQVNAWLAEHADYHGHIYMNYGQDDPDITVTDIFARDTAIAQAGTPLNAAQQNTASIQGKAA